MHCSLLAVIPKQVYQQYNLVIADIINYYAQIKSLYLNKAMEPYEM